MPDLWILQPRLPGSGHHYVLNRKRPVLQESRAGRFLLETGKKLIVCNLPTRRHYPLKQNGEGGVGMNRTTKQMLIATGAVVAGAAAMGTVSQSVTGFLMKVALDRDLPKIRNPERARGYLSGIDGLDAFLKLRGEAGERLKQKVCKEVYIHSYDGAKLVGHWRPAPHAERIILAMHGWRSSWSDDFGVIADFWHTNRCSVLYVEQRGQNNSGGACMGFGLLERFDCREWLKWIEQQVEGNLPIYPAGVSMGGATVLMAAGLDLPGNVRGIIADCAFTSPEAVWRHVARNNLRLSYGLRSIAINEICRNKLQMRAGDYSTVDALRQCEIPVLLIHGTDDHFVPVGMTYENYKACRGPKRLFIVPGADHGMSYVVDQPGYHAAMTDFWNFCEKISPQT